ncbi:ROK family protein [Fodinibius sediminis]|uniref:Glucokinase n=1 Tax=Fodinibius sediminis TaxID=1214077 RepID=A0A521D6L8_9BACT|nr:ROK family protein [Fodinibius sediminis]SMO66711.1 glucokinase [Fodinibius sediminis]
MDDCLIGIDIDATTIRVACIQDNEIENMVSEEIRDNEDKYLIIDQIAVLVDRVLIPQVSGIGLGVPSVVDTQKGIVYDVQNIPSWEEVPVKAIYEKKFQLPVFVNNNANCFVLGEKYFGKGQSFDTVVGLVVCDSGLGAGIIIDGMLYEGRNCGAGEVGMFPYRNSIMEHYCSGQFFSRREGITALEACRLAAEGNAQIQALFEEFGIHFGIAVEAVIYAYDPEMIIIGGPISRAFSFFKDTMYSSLESFAYQNSLKKIAIEVTEDKRITLKGAAALVLENKLNCQV